MGRRCKINFIQLTSLIHASRHFPVNTPKRWCLISQFVIRASEGYADDILLSEVGEGREITEFQGSEEHCKAVHNILVKNDCDVFDYASAHAELLFEDNCRTGFKPVILLPGKTNCCAKRICIRYV